VAKEETKTGQRPGYGWWMVVRVGPDDERRTISIINNSDIVIIININKADKGFLMLVVGEGEDRSR
jgi:hypothetical protein